MAKKKIKKLTDKQLAHYRQLLLEKLQEITGDVFSMEESVFDGSGELSSMPVHLADIGTDSYEQEFSLGLMAEEKKMLAEIMEALQRIADGTYGFCEGLGTLIEEPRLEAIPWTRYSLEYARMLESGKVSKYDNFKRRPIDIEREADDEDEDSDDDDNNDTEVDFDDNMESLDTLEDEDDNEDGSEDDDYAGKRRHSA